MLFKIHFFDFVNKVNFISKPLSILFLILISVNTSAIEATTKSQSLNKNNVIESQRNQLKFEQLSTFHGLSNSNVFGVTQDHLGFIWFATEDGLNRFDGNTFVTYRHDVSDKFSIADNVIRKIFIDSENTLWIGTQTGLSRYNFELDNFYNYVNIPGDNSSLKDNMIWDIYQNKDLENENNKNNALLWISTTEGLHTVPVTTPPNEMEFQRVILRNYNERIKEIKTIFQDSSGTYWLGSFDKGIHLLSKNRNYLGSLKRQNKYDLLIDANALFDMKSIDGKYWLATDNGLYIVDDRYQLISHLTTSKTIYNKPLLSNSVRSIEKYDDNHVWLATHNGLNTVDLLNNTLESYQTTEEPISISENWLMDIYRDNNNNMWLASYGGGINKYSPLKDLFFHGLNKTKEHNYRVESFAESSDGTIWLTTELNGLFSLSPDKVLSKVELNIKENIWQVISVNGNQLFLKTESGKLFQYNTLKNTLIEHKLWQKQANHINGNIVLSANENLWYINKMGYLTQYNTTTKAFKVHTTSRRDKFLNFQISYEMIYLLSKDDQILTFDLNDLSFMKERIELRGDIDSKSINNLWVHNNNVILGSDSLGLVIINLENKQISKFNESNGLINNFIASLLIDDNENIWVATNSGLNYISLTTSEVIKFDIDFAINNPEFQNNVALKTKKGKMLYGGPNGFYQFSPNELLNIKQKITAPIFTNLYVENKKISILSTEQNNTETYTLKKQLNSLSKVELAYQQSPVSFEFVSPNVKLPTQLRYKYRLVGLEENWIDASIESKIITRATYTNLSPGDYIFEVQAFDLYHADLGKTSRLNIHILPPWWLATKMLAVYCFITLCIFIYIYKQFKNKRLYNTQIKESEERLKLSLWGSGDEMWDWNIVTDKIYRSNIWGILEFPQDGTRNKSKHKNINGGLKTNIHSHDLERVKKALTAHFSEKTEHFEATYRVKNKHNKWIWILDRGKIVERDSSNKPLRMTGTLKDISQIKKTEESLKLFARCIQNISDAVVIYDRQYFAVDVNKAFQRITGKDRMNMLGQPLSFTQYPSSFTDDIKKHLLSQGSWHGEIDSIREDGTEYRIDLNIDIIYDENHNISHFVSVFSDITKRKENEAELRKLASSDVLTGLPNRSFFQANQARLVKSNINHALLVFDLDNFKKINDSMGHQIGDAILCQVTKRMLNLVRKQDTIYRLGGDEFSIIIEGTNDIHTITTLAKEILTTIALPFKIRNQEVVLYSSIGIVLFPEDGLTGHELLKNADTAMYHAKGSGGNRYQFFSDSMNKQAVKRLQIENLIRHGLKEDLFTVYYQPKIEIATGKISGMEALVRFETPSKGIISPYIFIPVSEETGQIIDIGEIVLKKACFAAKKWVEAGLFTGRVAVNLSAVQFTQSNLVSQIANILKESKLPPKHLELEITEGTVMNSPQTAIDTMLQIRAMGVHLSLDDFGTGYSSLAYLKQFPLNTLKIDKAFIDDIEDSEQGRNMVATIVTIAHNLGMDVVAEGVETNQQLDYLASLKCEQLQGYLYSKPLAHENFQKYLLSHQITNRSTTFN